MLKKNMEATEAFLYFILLKEAWPAAAKNFIPQINFSESSIYDIYNKYIQKFQPNTLSKKINLMLVQLAENLPELSLDERISLFEEAIHYRSESLPLIYSRYITFMARFGHDDHILLEICNRFKDFSGNAWDKNCEYGWLYYIALLLRNKEEHYASKILKKFIYTYGPYKISSFPHIANFAKKCGIRTHLISDSSFLFDYMQNLNGEKILKKYLLNKRIAVVGSSFLEINQNNGNKIDSNDIIIRVNHTPHPDYYSDFGKKTSIITYGLSSKINFYIPEDSIFAIEIEGIERHPLSKYNIKKFVKLAKLNKIIFPSLKSIYEIMSLSSYTQFSSGIMTIAYFEHITKSLTYENIYGFTHLLNGDYTQYGELPQYHFYAARSDDPRGNTLFHAHSLKREREFLKKILWKG